MPSGLIRRLAAVILPIVMLAASPALNAGEIYSTMRNVNAVPEAHGFRLNPAFDAAVPQQSSDLSPPQAFEILRPADKPVTIGRLFTSCSCIQLESNKRTYRPGERAILQLHNIRPTPPAGQVYAVFVQITSPIRTTLRFDTFVQSYVGGTAGAPGGAGPGSDPNHNQGPNNPGLNNHGPNDPNSGTASLLLDNQSPNPVHQTAPSGPDSHNQLALNHNVAASPAAGGTVKAEPPKISAVKIIEEEPVLPRAATVVTPTLPVAPLSVKITPEDTVTAPKTPVPAPAATALPTAPLVQLPTAPLVAGAPASAVLQGAIISARDKEASAKVADSGVNPALAAVARAAGADDPNEAEEGEENQESEEETDNYLTDGDVTAPPAPVVAIAPAAAGPAANQTTLPALPGVTVPARGSIATPPMAVEPGPMVVEIPVAVAPAPQPIRRTTAVIPAPTPQVTAVPVTPLPPLAGKFEAPLPIARPSLAPLPTASTAAEEIAAAEMDEGQAPLGVPPTIVAGPGAVLQAGPRIAVPAAPAGQASLLESLDPEAEAAAISGADLTPEEYERMILSQRYDRNLDKDILTQFATVPPAIDPFAGKADPHDEAAQGSEGTADFTLEFGDALGDLPSAQSRPRIAVPPSAPVLRNGPQIPLQTPAQTQMRNSPIIIPDADIIPSGSGEAVGARAAEVIDGGVRGMVRGAWESPEQAQAHGIEVREVNLPAGVAAPLTAPATGAGVVTVPIPVPIQALPQAVQAPRLPQPTLIPQPVRIQQVPQPMPVQPYQQPVPAEQPASLTVREVQPAQIATAVGPMPAAQNLNLARRAAIPPEGIPIPPAVERNPKARKPVQAVSLITVGVRDLPSAIRFYEALGWTRTASGKYDQTAFFQLQGQVLALYPMHDLLREQNMQNAQPAPGGITLALHVQDRADVWSVYQRFLDAGGSSLRVPSEMPSGAVSCYVADPDGNPWEISWVPQFHIDEDGGLWLP